MNGFPLGAFALPLFDFSDSVFATADVLPTVLDLSDFDVALFFLFFDFLEGEVSGTITSLSTPVETVVPEPSTILLLGSGLGALVARRYRQRTEAR